MTIEQRVAVLEEIFSKLQDYYMSGYSGEEIDALLASAGVPIGITKEYDSVSAMNSDFSGTDVTRGQFVLILTTDTSSEDYGKVYLKGSANWVYVFTLTSLTAIKGPQGPAGKRGAKGADGADGKNFMVLGYYETLSALNAAVPSPGTGDTYGVGTEPPYAFYMYDPTISNWRYVGNLQGPEGPVGGSSNFVRYDAAQTLTDEQKAQARGNIGAADNSYTGGRKQNGTLVNASFTTQGWYRIVTGAFRSGGILTVQHSYGSGGPSALKLLVSMNGYGNAIKCIEYTDYESSAITNVRMVSNASGQYFIDVYYRFNVSNNGAIDFISTGQVEATVQEPVFIAADDTLPDGETLLTTMEYLNPPMLLGVEYRTTERYLGKPVYVKAVDCGNLPAPGSTKNVSHSISGCLPIMVTAQMSNSNTIPWLGKFTVGADNTNIVLYSPADTSDFSGLTAMAILKYTKTTD